MPGSIGNSSYAGHRTPGDLGPADTLKPGDPIIIQTADHWYVYEMQSSWMTTPMMPPSSPTRQTKKTRASSRSPPVNTR